MTDHNSDREAFQPVGEGALVPDPALDQPADSQPTRQREASHSGGYPDGTTDTDRACISCGASIPASQRKCRFCLEHELDAASASGAASSEQTLRGVIQFLVKSSTFYGAVAKGAAAAKLLTSGHDEPIDDCTLIYDLDDEPAPQLTERWPTLPAATEVTSAAGDALLTAARERTAWDERSDRSQTEIPRVYDERGQGIRDESSLEHTLDDSDQLWIVPAIAVERVPRETESTSTGAEIPTVTALECHHCTKETEHRFRTRESLPDETWTGQPIWECQVCGTGRYGPAPE
ncbi:hypothetical protein SAMN04488065_2569 [Haloplanus vescus]|uniref:DUF7995 domain-containing protein n=1 Tax=Haloplanus vescus TaxID=555874 RepID=A0A1H3ZUN7_9EURY|nr:hypothetical protein [Haloplanus vescus]SEA27380.1 hypothetical protein SAMN04488065_2475 [Haloplanus vescus]SEA29337.1 hypothetical protein SAMN04488065_2569 [Haloplanus vescus]